MESNLARLRTRVTRGRAGRVAWAARQDTSGQAPGWAHDRPRRGSRARPLAAPALTCAIVALAALVSVGLAPTPAAAADALGFDMARIEYFGEDGGYLYKWRDAAPTVTDEGDRLVVHTDAEDASRADRVLAFDEDGGFGQECTVDPETGDVTVPAELRGHDVTLSWYVVGEPAGEDGVNEDSRELPEDSRQSEQSPLRSLLTRVTSSLPLFSVQSGDWPTQLYVTYNNPSGDPTYWFVYGQGSGGQGTRGRWASENPIPNGSSDAAMAFCIDPNKNIQQDDGTHAWAAQDITSALSGTSVDIDAVRAELWFGLGGPGYDSSLWSQAGCDGATLKSIFNAPAEWDAQVVAMHVMLADQVSGNAAYALAGMSETQKAFCYEHILGNDANGNHNGWDSALRYLMGNRRSEVPSQDSFHVMITQGSSSWQRILTWVYRKQEEPKTTSLDVRKVWDDGSGPNRPSQITVTLTPNDGSDTKTVTLSADNGWRYHEEGIPEGRTYTASEDFSDTTNYQEPTYEGQGSLSITITNKATETTGYRISKVWKNATDGHPDSVTVTVTGQANGQPTGYSETVTLSEDNGWSYERDELPARTADGSEITYTVEEQPFEGQSEYHDPNVEVRDSGITITNEKKAKTKLSVTKRWSGGEDSTRADSIDFEVTGKVGDDVVYTGSLTLSAANSWYAELDGLEAVDDNGSDVYYTVTEGSWSGGDRSAWQDEPDVTRAGNDFTFTNKAKPGHLRVTKVVTGTDATDKEFQVQIHLSDGTTSYATLRAGQQTEFDIPAGLTYQVEESTLPAGYALVGIDGASGTISAGQTYEATITNSYAAEGDWTPEAYKVMLQRTLQDGEFSFTLTDADSGSTLQSGLSNTAAGVVSMDPIHFTYSQVGRTYHYRVTETKGSDGDVEYSTSGYTYNVTPKDNGDGTLGFDVSVTDGTTQTTPTFTNGLKPGTLEVEKYVQGTNPDADTKFTFKVTFSTPEGTTLPRDSSGHVGFTRYQATSGAKEATTWDDEEDEDAGILSTMMRTLQNVFSPQTVADDPGDGTTADAGQVDVTDPSRVVVATSDTVPDTPEGGTVVTTDGNLTVYAFDDADAADAARESLEGQDGVNASGEVTFTPAEDDADGAATTTVDPTTAVEAISQDVPDYTGQDVIALIDTGAPEGGSGVVGTYSVLGDDGVDRQGHGSEMLSFIHDTYPDAKVVSIKAMDDTGNGSLTSVTAALKLAQRMNVSVVNLSLSARGSGHNTVLDDLFVTLENEGGAQVVVAAGNFGSPTSGYVPANTYDALVMGACDPSGNRRDFSNWGDNVYSYVVADSTSEAAARMSALTVQSLDTGERIDRPDLLFVPDTLQGEDPEMRTATPRDAEDEAPEVAADGFTVQSNSSGKLTDWLTRGSISYGTDAKNAYIITPAGNTSAYATSSSSSSGAKVNVSSSWLGNGYDNHDSLVRQTWTFQQSKSGNWYVIRSAYGEQKWNLDNNGSNLITYLSGSFDDNETFAVDGAAGDGDSASSVSFIPYIATDQALTNNGSGSQITRSARDTAAGVSGSNKTSQQWKVRYAAIKVNYDLNGGSGGNASSKSGSLWYFHQSQTIASAPSRSGYTFKGWKLNNSAGTMYTAGQSCSFTAESHSTTQGYGTNTLGCSPDQVVTFTAQWEKDTVYYDVTYDANGGSGAPSSQSVEEGKSVTLRTTRPTRSGYTFTGWNTRSNGRGTSYSAGQYISSLNSDLTLYAQWEEEASRLYFDANGGSGGPDTQTVRSSSTASITIPASKPYRFNYTFLGWSTSRSATTATYQPGGTVRVGVGDSVTLYAVWELDPNYATVDGDTITFQLKQNEGARFDDLPAGTSYIVWEETPAGWQQVSSSGTTGTIDPNGTDTATVTNKTVPLTEPARVILHAHKDVDGASDTTGGYQFQLYEGSSLLQTKADDKSGAVTFDAITYSSAGTHTYTIKEVAGDDATMRYDTHEETVTVTVTSTTAGLTAAATYDSDGPTFDNTHNPGTITVTKAVTGTEDASVPFTFTLKLAGQQPQTFTLKAGESKTFEGITAGTAYEVTEANVPSGYTLRGIENGTGTVGAGQQVQVRATNAYTSLPVKARLSATKSFEGATLRDGQFTFTLSEGGKVIDTVANAADGTVAFKEITYAEPGEHDYEIAETAGTDGSVTYDTHVSKVHVSVTDDGSGQLKASSSQESSAFVNTYQQGALRITKRWSHGTRPDPATTPSFDITLKAADGTGYTGAIPVTLGADTFDLTFTDGKATLTRPMADGDTATLTIPYGYTYEVGEQEISGYQTTTTGPTSGTISATASEVTFDNTYTSTGSWTPTVQKRFVGRSLAAGAFTFELRDADGNVLDTAENDADGNVTFDTRDVDASMLGGTTTYTISEVAGDDASVSYDDHAVDVMVLAEDDGQGHIVCDVRYDGSTIPYTFTNTVRTDMPVTGMGGILRPVLAGLAVVAAGTVATLVVMRRRRHGGGTRVGW